MLSKAKLRNSRGQSPWLLMFILPPSAKTGYFMFYCLGGTFPVFQTVGVVALLSVGLKTYGY